MLPKNFILFLKDKAEHQKVKMQCHHVSYRLQIIAYRKFLEIYLLAHEFMYQLNNCSTTKFHNVRIFSSQ